MSLGRSLDCAEGRKVRGSIYRAAPGPGRADPGSGVERGGGQQGLQAVYGVMIPRAGPESEITQPSGHWRSGGIKGAWRAHTGRGGVSPCSGSCPISKARVTAGRASGPQGKRKTGPRFPVLLSAPPQLLPTLKGLARGPGGRERILVALPLSPRDTLQEKRGSWFWEDLGMTPATGRIAELTACFSRGEEGGEWRKSGAGCSSASQHPHLSWNRKWLSTLKGERLQVEGAAVEEAADGPVSTGLGE